MKKFALVVMGLLVAAPSAFAGYAYAFDLRGDNEMLTFPAAAPAENIFTGVLNYDTFAIDFNTAGDTLYSINTAAELGTISTVDGSFATIAAVSGLVGSSDENFTGISFDPTNDAMYVSTFSATDTLGRLYTMDEGTGVATYVADFSGNGGLPIDIAFRGNGDLYMHDILDDAIYSVDKATGVSTQLALTGYAAGFAQGMDFDYDTDLLYATIYTGGGTGAYVSFDPNTNTLAEILVTTPWNKEMELAITPIPEPATLALVALGGLALIRRR